MERIRQIFKSRPAYKPLEPEDRGEADSLIQRDGEERVPSEHEEHEGNDIASQPDDCAGVKSFLWIEYYIFTLLGVAMLWTWNMFLSAAPYFQKRFKSAPSLFTTFQPTELIASTVCNLIAMLILTYKQRGASYPRRISYALVLNVIVSGILAVSTTPPFQNSTPSSYFAFLVLSVAISSIATGLLQNGILAYVGRFAAGQDYMQGIMVGQAVAGVLPCIVQIVSVFFSQQSTLHPEGDFDAGFKDSPDRNEEDIRQASKAALAYFLTATAISLVTLFAFFYLHLSRKEKGSTQSASSSTALLSPNRIPLMTLFHKTFWLSSSVFLTLGLSMFFPVLTTRITSVNEPAESTSSLFLPSIFIPIAFLCWNIGDLTGRLMSALPAVKAIPKHHPRLLLLSAVSRVLFIPMYYLCNIRGVASAPIIPSDLFYLLIVQGGFGLTNGMIGTLAMMGAREYVDPDEVEAVGAWMGLCLTAGLAAGSAASFSVAG